MERWPDEDESFLIRYVEQLGYPAGYRSWLRQFHRFVRDHSPQAGLTDRVFYQWIHNRTKETTRSFAIRQTEFVYNFLEWLVSQSVLRNHPLKQLQNKYHCRSIRAIAGALMSPNPNQDLEALRPLPRYGSHL